MVLFSVNIQMEFNEILIGNFPPKSIAIFKNYVLHDII